MYKRIGWLVSAYIVVLIIRGKKSVFFASVRTLFRVFIILAKLEYEVDTHIS